MDGCPSRLPQSQLRQWRLNCDYMCSAQDRGTSAVVHCLTGNIRTGPLHHIRILLYSYTSQDPAMQDVIDQVAALYGPLEGWKVNKAGVMVFYFLPDAHEGDDISTDISDVETEDG